LVALRSDWQVDVFLPAVAARAAFGAEPPEYVHTLPAAGDRSRLRWEFLELPALLRDDPDALLYFPSGVPLNLSLAPRAVWMSRNLIPLLPIDEWEVSEADRPRMLALRGLIAMCGRAARTSICVSQHARERLSALARIDVNDIVTIPHGVDPVEARAASTPACERHRGTRYALYVGQPIAYRRALELFQAYVLLEKRRPDVPPLVVLGGARPQDVEYERLCMEALAPLVARGKAYVLGQVSHADVQALMASAHAFLYPSVHEDCPNVVLEALSAGRVGVYADIPAVRELAAGAGIYVRDPRPPALVEAIERALFDEGSRARISAEAEQRAALFTWQRTAERTAEALEASFAKPRRVTR
jgi:glycosyltransferase involved in cell wall biosynthesis